jgi:hypothetical protein
MRYGDRLHELVDAVVDGSVSLPGTNGDYYVNYSLKEGSAVHKWITNTERETYIGPYPHAVAELIRLHWVPGLTSYKGGGYYVTTGVKVALKPRKGSTEGTGPSKEQIEQLLVDRIARDMDTYRRLQEWYSEGNR